MARKINQLRPKGDPTAMPYSPQRDLANIYTPMLKEVFQGLDKENWAPYLQEWFERDNVTEQQLSAGVSVFVEAHRAFIRDRTVDTPWEAFEQAGVSKLPAAVRVAIFERIGEVVMGGWFVGIRDVTAQGELSPAHADLMQMIAAGRALAKRLSGHKYTPREVDKAELQLAECEEAYRIQQQVLTTVQDATYKTRAALQETSQLLKDAWAPIYYVRKQNWFKRIFSALHYAWEIYWG